jgi:cytochrome c peroxidase
LLLEIKDFLKIDLSFLEDLILKKFYDLGVPFIFMGFRLSLAFGTSAQASDLPNKVDLELQILIQRHQISPLEPPRKDRAALVRLGQRLFFDPILSGNRDTACVSCHHPRTHSRDGLPFSIGTGGKGMPPRRTLESGLLTQ